MAEVKAEGALEGNSLESERHAALNLSVTVDPALSGSSLIQEVTLMEMEKEPFACAESESKDFPGSESIIPLSPQWLFSKHGDGKLVMAPSDVPQAPTSASNGTSNESVSKERWRPEGNRDADKRKDWRRTVATEGDGSAGNRRERWREDERESSLLGRRDRWKEGGDSTDRRVDRWAETSTMAREPAENRRTQHSERRSESANRETSYETRRDSKWNTRWGPEDKEKEGKRDQRLDFEKEGEGHREKQYCGTHRNEIDRELDASARDKWRPHSITSKSKGEIPPPLSSPSPKAAPGFGIGRGRGDITPAGFAVGRGRANMSGINPLHGIFSSIGSPLGTERGDVGSGFRYPRAKLLDIYRKSSVSFLNKKYPDGFSEVAQLTQSDPVEPLAFFTPDMDEEVVLEGILKGDVLTSGAAHTTPKEQTSNKSRENGGWNRARGRTVGNKEGGQSEASREDSFTGFNLALREDCKRQNGDGKDNDISVALCSRLASGNVSGSSSVKEASDANSYAHAVCEFFKQNSMLEPKESKNVNCESGAFLTSIPVDGGQANLLDLGGKYDERTKALDKLTSLHISQSSEGDTCSHSENKDCEPSSQILEELSLFYIDPQGVVQGPFSGADIIDWFKAGFFGTDLMVRTADSPENAPFTQLCKIMPHLQTSSEGFSAAVPSKGDAGYQESNDTTMKVSSTSKYVQPVVDFSGRTLHLGNLQADGQSFDAGGSVKRRDMTVGKVPEYERAATMSDEAAMLKRASSFPQRMAGLPQIPNDDLQSAVQHWSALPENPGLIAPNAGHPSSRAEFLYGVPELFSPPVGSVSLDRSWSDMSPRKETPPQHLPSHGLDPFHMHHLQQLDMHQSQQQLDSGPPFPHVLQQRQQLRQAQLAEHLLSSGQAQHSSGVHSLQHLTNPRMPPRLQHQHSFPVQASESTLEQLFRLQQQQQQQHPHAYLEQLLRQNQQVSGVDHLHGSPILTDRQLRRLQEASRTDNQAQQVEQVLSRHTYEFLLQRQQQQQARQHALLVHQQLASLNEQRICGVWEVDEFGQFVQTQASNPMHSPEVFHHQQPQRHRSFSPMQHLGALQGGVSGRHNSQLRLSRSEMRKLADLEMQKNLASLLDGTTSMPAEMLAQLQSEIARFEAQNLSLPQKGSFEVHTNSLQNVHNLPLPNGEVLSGRGWNTGPDLGKQQVKEMLNRGVSNTTIFDQLSAKNDVPVVTPNWRQDPLFLQTDANRRSKAFAANADNCMGSALRPHNRSEKLADQVTSEDLLGVLSSRSFSSHSLSGQRGNVPPSSFREQQVMSNLWTAEYAPPGTDYSSAQAGAPQPSLFELGDSLKANHWDMDWPKTDMSHVRELPFKELSKSSVGPGYDLSRVVGEVRTATPPLLHEGGNIIRRDDSRDRIQHSSYLTNDDNQSAATFIRSGSVTAEDLRGVLPATPSHLLGDAQQAKEDNACSRLAVWSSDVKTHAKTENPLKEIQEVPRTVIHELEGVPLSLQGQRQANNRVLSTASLPGIAVTRQQRAPSPSFTKSSAPPHHVTIMQSTTPGDEDLFWDHNISGNTRTLSSHDKLLSQKEQFGKAPNEGFMDQASAAGSAHMPGFEFSLAVTRPVQPIARDPPVLKPQDSLTIADAKALREWCEEQINLRRGLNESTSDYLESGPAFEALKAEFLRRKDSMRLETMHPSVPAAEFATGDKVVAVDTGISDKPKKSSEGEEEPDSEPLGHSFAAKSAKKKAKKGKKVVDPSLLGFNVASNRILMGEIQHVDE